MDLGTEYRAEFKRQAERDGSEIIPGPVEAPNQRGLTERAGGLFKNMLYKAMEDYSCQGQAEWRELVDIVCMMRNRLLMRAGYSPIQRVLGYSPRLPGGLMTGGEQDFMVADLVHIGDEPARRAMKMRRAAAVAFHTADCERALREATLAGPRRIANFEVGQAVYFWRKGAGTNKKMRQSYWHGPARVIMTSLPSAVWIAYQNTVVKAAPERVRPVTEEESLSMSGWLSGITKLREDFEKMPLGWEHRWRGQVAESSGVSTRTSASHPDNRQSSFGDPRHRGQGGDRRGQALRRGLLHRPRATTRSTTRAGGRSLPPGRGGQREPRRTTLPATQPRRPWSFRGSPSRRWLEADWRISLGGGGSRGDKASCSWRTRGRQSSAVPVAEHLVQGRRPMATSRGRDSTAKSRTTRADHSWTTVTGQRLLQEPRGRGRPNHAPLSWHEAGHPREAGPSSSRRTRTSRDQPLSPHTPAWAGFTGSSRRGSQSEMFCVQLVSTP